MKSLSWAVLGLLMAAPSFAADNNIKMVTYFPVPYAAYGDLGVTGTCDVGLMGQCKLDAGKSLTVAKASSDSRALNTGSIIVRKGALGLNPASSLAAGTSITAGSGTGTGVLEFSHDLAVTNINSSRISKARAMNEAQLDSLNMYGHAFPACDAKNHEISWKSLTLGNKTGVFLVCGAGEEAEETCEQNPNQEKCCTILQEWDGSKCVDKEPCQPPRNPGSYSCTFTYVNPHTRKEVTIKGMASEHWNQYRCAMERPVQCVPGENVWLKTLSMTGGACLGGNVQKVTSPMTDGSTCGGYGSSSVYWVYYYPQPCKNSMDQSCYCEGYLCTNISPSSKFDCPTCP